MSKTPSNSLNDQRDEQLVERYRNGETTALEVLISRHHQELYHFLARFVSDRTAGEDLFQETFVQVHLSADTFDTSRRFRPWLFTIAANKARDYLRKMKRRAAIPLSGPMAGDARERSVLDLLQDDLPLPDQQAVSAEQRLRVRSAIEQLPDHLREFLLLAYFHQLPYKQIAEMLEIPLGTVKSRLHTAVGTFGKTWQADPANRSGGS